MLKPQTSKLEALAFISNLRQFYIRDEKYLGYCSLQLFGRSVEAERTQDRRQLVDVDLSVAVDIKVVKHLYMWQDGMKLFASLTSLFSKPFGREGV